MNGGPGCSSMLGTHVVMQASFRKLVPTTCRTESILRMETNWHQTSIHGISCQTCCSSNRQLEWDIRSTPTSITFITMLPHHTTVFTPLSISLKNILSTKAESSLLRDNRMQENTSLIWQFWSIPTTTSAKALKSTWEASSSVTELLITEPFSTANTNIW